MRNLFDQYEQPENRLTHALAVCLNEDRELLGAFVSGLGIGDAPDAKRLIVDEQALPGEEGAGEADAEQRGLPDIVIHDDDSWCAFIECKVNAELSTDQLDRHRRTLERRGFGTVVQVVLTKEGVKTPQGTVAFTWPRLYEFLGAMTPASTWGLRLRDYLRAAEVRLALDGYLSEGTLTMFDGFPFSGTYPYSYGEAKRLIRLAMDELRKEPSLIELGIDPLVQGRPSIPESDGKAVWDYLFFKEHPHSSPHTAYPHLTLVIRRDSLDCAVILPHKMLTEVWRRLKNLDADRMTRINRQVTQQAARLREAGATIEANAHQRHYNARRMEVDDAMLRFRLEASLPEGGGGTKHQPEWAPLFVSLIRRRVSNIEFRYVARLPWTLEALKTRQAVSIIAEAWCATKPLLDFVRDTPSA